MKTALTLALILTASWCWGLELPDAPSVAHKALVTAAILSIGADAYTTQHDWAQTPVREVNGIARPFVSHGPYLRAGYFAATATGFYFADRRLNRRHPRLARALEFGVIGAEIYWSEYNVRNGKGW